MSVQGTFSASCSSPRRERLGGVLTLSVTHLLEGGFVSKEVFARFYDEGETRGNGLGGLGGLGLFGGCHCLRQREGCVLRMSVVSLRLLRTIFTADSCSMLWLRIGDALYSRCV